MNLSNRILSMQFSPIRKLMPYCKTAEKKGILVYHLNIGQPDIKTPIIFLKKAKEFNTNVLKYTSSEGICELINSFRQYYKCLNIEFDNDEILVTNGGSEALVYALLTVCDNNDEVIIPEPFYTNYNGFCDIAGIKVNPFLTKSEDGFHLPPKEIITKKITNKTKAIIITNPGNPTGVVYTYDEIKMLIDIAKENNLYLIADEVYREFVYDNLSYTSILSVKDGLDNIILIDSISKRYSACGARIGIAASKNKNLMHQMLKLCQTRLCVPTIEQFAAASLINTPKEYFNNVKYEYQGRRDILYQNLSQIPGVICKKPEGAFYIIAELPVDNAEKFSKWLLTDFSYDNKTIMLAPAEGFYATKGLGKKQVRISYCINKEYLRDAMGLLKRALNKYNGN